MRVTQNMKLVDFQYHINRQDKAVNDLYHKISSQSKYKAPHENPAEVRMGMNFRNVVNEYERYEFNVKNAEGKLNYLDTQLGEVTKYLQRIGELAVQGANGTYTQDDRNQIAVEVDQYLRELVQIANSRYGGDSIFSGSSIRTQAFEISESRLNGGNIPMIVGVKYKGDLGKQYNEISRGEYIETALNGNEVFGASNVRIESNTVATNFISDSDQVIKINGIEIKVQEGDNLETVVNKINSTNLSVRAEVVNKEDNKYIAVSSTEPHEMWLEDIGGGNVLQTLGLIAQGGSNPPDNYSPSATVSGDNMFDKIIRLRDALMNDGAHSVGNQIDGIVEDSLNNIIKYRTRVGANSRRLDNLSKYLSKVKIDALELQSSYLDVDTFQAVSDLKNMEAARNVTLQLGSRIIPRTLLDFLR